MKVWIFKIRDPVWQYSPLRHAAKLSQFSILNVSLGKITHNLTVYLQCMDCKNLLHAKVHLPLRALQCFKGLDMSAV